jgi:predicted nuclease with TOPRIM domain
MQKGDDGDWVLYDASARLKAEVEELKDALFKHSGENYRLQIQRERMTKAGDAMADELIRLEAAFNNIESAEAQMWYIAKEGGCP